MSLVTVEKYWALEFKLSALREFKLQALQADLDDGAEDAILDDMDKLWWDMDQTERDAINSGSR
jgi:hypothetical protein